MVKIWLSPLFVNIIEWLRLLIQVFQLNKKLWYVGLCLYCLLQRGTLISWQGVYRLVLFLSMQAAQFLQALDKAKKR